MQAKETPQKQLKRIPIRENLDRLELQDTDAFYELEAHEKLGLCGPGESGKLIDDGV